MNLFKLNKDTYSVEFDEGALMLAPFRVLWDRDKSKKKTRATKELAYIYFMWDVQSDYKIETDIAVRSSVIIKDLELGDKWSVDSEIEDAATFYRDRSTTVLSRTYNSAVAGANAVNDVLENAKQYISSANNPIKAAKDVIDTLGKVPKVMADLKAANKELVEESKENAIKQKGSQTLNMFEDGFK